MDKYINTVHISLCPGFEFTSNKLTALRLYTATLTWMTGWTDRQHSSGNVLSFEQIFISTMYNSLKFTSYS